ncbi:MAG TPA: hypothetical protein VFT40_00765 [Sphingomicrobium sp.]|jgi:hypothetical protein|nr:hypothetical protein [Sphingomicrobium sp.]
MASSGSVIGWKLDRLQRAELLERFPPRYRDAIADHVTLKSNSERDELPGPAASAIVGRADDGDSLECMVVTINGTIDRPDGSTFHITWSLDKSKGRQARESNDVLKQRGWSNLPEPLPIKLEPARF